MKKAVIIGAAGFVGGYLAEHLLREYGWAVTATKMEQETLAIGQVKTRDLDLLEQDAVEVMLEEEQPDYVFHLAAQSSVSLSWKNPQLTIDVNVKGTCNLLEAVRRSGAKPRMLLVGSGEEYGHIWEGESPVKETNVLRPGNIYAATKACQNMLGCIYADAYGMDIMMARAFNHIGPKQDPLFVVADFCKQVAEIEQGRREPVIRVGNLAARRDFTDVRDVVRAYGLIACKGVSGTTYNVGSGRSVSIRDILDTILSMSDTGITVETDSERFRPADVPDMAADITRLQDDTGWSVEIPLEDTIRETLNYWREKSEDSI